MRAYEIQIYSNGQWQIQAIFDDQELALLEARRIRASRPSKAVRVVEEEFDPAYHETKSRVVFRSTPVDEHNAEAMERTIDLRRELAARQTQKAAASERSVSPPPVPARSGPSLVTLLILFIGIVGGGLAVLAWLASLRG